MLEKKLRLFKNGDISYVMDFQRNKTLNCLFTKRIHPYNSVRKKVFTVKECELFKLENHFNTGLKENNLAKLSLSYFNLAYKTNSALVRITLFVTVLEVLFNFGKEQITHTVARHMAIVVSNSKDEFQDYYSKIKKLYHLRSEIVHGTKIKPNIDLNQKSLELQDFARKAIVFVMEFQFFREEDKHKEELFEYFNSKGF